MEPTPLQADKEKAIGHLLRVVFSDTYIVSFALTNEDATIIGLPPVTE